MANFISEGFRGAREGATSRVGMILAPQAAMHLDPGKFSQSMGGFRDSAQSCKEKIARRELGPASQLEQALQQRLLQTTQIPGVDLSALRGVREQFIGQLGPQALMPTQFDITRGRELAGQMAAPERAGLQQAFQQQQMQAG